MVRCFLSATAIVFIDILDKSGRVADRIPPATIVSGSGLGGDRAGFVEWHDERFQAQINAWIDRCS